MPGRAWRSPLRNDHVTLDRIDLDAPVLEPPDPALEHAFVALELEHHPPVVGLPGGGADVDQDVEALHEPVDDRFLNQRRRKGEADAHAGHRTRRPGLPSSDRGHDRHLVAVLEGRFLGLEEPDVLLVDVDVDETTQLAGLVEQSLFQARELPLEIVDDAVDRGALGLDLGVALRESAERRGNPYEHRHACSSSTVWALGWPREGPRPDWQGWTLTSGPSVHER